MLYAQGSEESNSGKNLVAGEKRSVRLKEITEHSVLTLRESRVHQSITLKTLASQQLKGYWETLISSANIKDRESLCNRHHPVYIYTYS